MLNGEGDLVPGQDSFNIKHSPPSPFSPQPCELWQRELAQQADWLEGSVYT